MIVILGAGAMGSALATHWARRHRDVILLATERDGAALEAWHHQLPHPALGIPMTNQVPCLPPEDWPGALAAADLVVTCVSSEGLRPVMSRAVAWASGRAVWVMVSKGWQTDATLYAPSELAASILGGDAPVVSMGGPALAAEIVVGAPTALVLAAPDPGLAEEVASTMRSSTLAVAVTGDVTGVETASAYKNVVAIAVGMCEGLSERLGQMAFVHSFANARAAVFAQGLVDMARLAEARGGQAATVLGLAGAGDVFVTSLGGRNGRYGRLLGTGQSPERALRAIGSTVEGIGNTAAALGLAERLSLELPTARAVDMALHERILGDEGLAALRDLFSAAVTHHHIPPVEAR